MSEEEGSPAVKALITGVTGQDGSYLAEFLLKKGYEVHGTVRRSSNSSTGRIDHIYQAPGTPRQRFFLHYADLTDTANVCALVKMIRPREIYNLAAQSHVKVSFEMPEYTLNVNAVGVQRILDAIRGADLQGYTRFYQASTSELFGGVCGGGNVLNESSTFHPRSPYACAKLCAHALTINYRNAYDMFACNGILFNHESPRRGITFVTRKITMAAVRIASGEQNVLTLGNLDARRDWGHAKDYVEAMWLMLQHKKARDFVVATGENHTVREFASKAFEEAGLPLTWEGSGLDEVAYKEGTRNALIRVDQAQFRPEEVDCLVGDASDARRLLHWNPVHSFSDLVKDMVHQDDLAWAAQSVRSNPSHNT